MIIRYKFLKPYNCVEIIFGWEYLKIVQMSRFFAGVQFFCESWSAFLSSESLSPVICLFLGFFSALWTDKNGCLYA